MTARFEIPVQLSDYNVFAIDDFLRSIQSAEQRQALIRRVGHSVELRHAYETDQGLPSGAVEVAMLAQDRRIKELGARLRQSLDLSETAQPSPEQLKTLYNEVESMTSGLRQLYPDALQFLKNYGVLAQRNKNTYAGDYHYGNDYRVLLANACPGPPPAPNPWFEIDKAVWLLGWVSVFVAADVIVAAISVLLAIAYLAAWIIGIVI